MSARAAWRLERLGHGPVYDYVAGKADWMASGLPTVRADTAERRALDAADRAPATCSPGTPLSELPAAGTVVVTSDTGVVLGRVGAGAGAGHSSAQTADEVMEPGPTTVRADAPLRPLLDRMADGGVDEMIVTTPGGRLLGVVTQR